MITVASYRLLTWNMFLQIGWLAFVYWVFFWFPTMPRWFFSLPPNDDSSPAISDLSFLACVCKSCKYNKASPTIDALSIWRHSITNQLSMKTVSTNKRNSNMFNGWHCANSCWMEPKLHLNERCAATHYPDEVRFCQIFESIAQSVM